jgi:SSS family solute:Na+ symporter
VTATLVVTFVGIALIAAVGFLGRRGAITDVSDWAVGGRSFGALTMWFLQAGEVFTTFTFLAMAGLAFAGGAAALYALPYIPLAYIGLYFLGPVLWRRARERGHVTQADFLADHFGSRGFGVLVAVLGVVFLLPYLQLQITGLGLAASSRSPRCRRAPTATARCSRSPGRCSRRGSSGSWWWPRPRPRWSRRPA